MVPFGQAMWNTPTCGSSDISYPWGEFWQGYHANARLCYNVICGADSDDFYGPRNDSECFNKAMGPRCQHGGAECAVNAIQACSKKLSNNDWTQYGPFAVCFEENYAAIQIPKGAHASSTYAQNRSFAETAINATMQTCVQNTSFKAEEVLSCFYKSEVEMLEDMAKATVPHVTVPFVRIMQCNGSWNVLQLGDGKPPDGFLVKAVCDAPCEGTTAAQKCSAIAQSVKQTAAVIM